jgi:type IV secretory pathway VirB10-like protein
VSWFAILLALASLGGAPSGAARKQCAKAAVTKHQKQQCKTATKKKTKTKPVAKVRPRQDPQPAPPGAQRKPDAPSGGGGASPTPTPTPTPAPGETPTPTPPPTATPDPVKYPSRTGVDLSEWIVRPTYRTLATGRVVFSTANLGEDDHNLSVRSGGTEYGKVDVAPGDTGSLVLQLAPGTYTLYCSLQGHEELGMRADISVR